MLSEEDMFEQVFDLLHAALKIGHDHKDADLVAAVVAQNPDLSASSLIGEGLRRHLVRVLDEIEKIDQDTEASHTQRVGMKIRRAELQRKAEDTQKSIDLQKWIACMRQTADMEWRSRYRYAQLMAIASERSPQSA